jgi:DNA polymerase-3 subunit delta
VILKSYIVEQNFGVLDEYRAVLLYGENDGIKDDVKFKLKNLNQDSEIINLFENEIIKNKNILYANVINESLFNEKKIIFIHLATDKILDEISEALRKNTKKTKIYIFSEILDKKSRLRKLFEKEKGLAIFPCYEDNERTLVTYVNKELRGYSGLTGEIVSIIIENSSSSRKIIKNELLKIKSFFFRKVINKIQLFEILNIKNNSGFEEIRDNALVGRKDKINKLLSQIDILGEDTFFYLNSLSYRIFKLTEIQKINETFDNYEKTLDSLKPPIFWKDKPIYLEQLKKWDLNKLNKAACKIGEAEILMKKNSQIRNDVVIKELLITLSKEASIFSSID